jgi:hypothetical protein
MSVAGLTGSTASTIKWVNGLKTKISASTLATGTLCPAGSAADEVVTGKVLADTTHHATVGSGYKFEVCLDSSNNLSLAPGTKAKI